jgi:hypothetical protein
LYARNPRTKIFRSHFRSGLSARGRHIAAAFWAKSDPLHHHNASLAPGEDGVFFIATPSPTAGPAAMLFPEDRIVDCGVGLLNKAY